MKKSAVFLIITMVFVCSVLAQDDIISDVNKAFYAANSLYEKGEYDIAIKEYNKVIKMGLESGSLYYNLANCYFKTGRLGYAMLYYEKAKRLIPQDSDLKMNIKFARSLISAPASGASRMNFIIGAVKAPFRDLNLNAIAIFSLLLFLLLLSVRAGCIFNAVFAKRVRVLCAIIIVLLFISVTAFIIRYYEEEVLRRGIVVQKNIECKYEPVDKSTTFYNLPEGTEVSVLNTRDGWRQIRRSDGKIGWVKQDCVEEI